MITATGPILERILDGTYPIWNEGISRQAYSRWNQAQMATAWGRDHLRRVAIVEDDRVLSSAKDYRFQAHVNGRLVSVLGIGAVFTPPELRGRGHARTLIDRLIAQARDEGCELALLFSEIGPTYYEAIGFRVLPRPSFEIEVLPGRRAGAPATLVRSGEAADFEQIAELAARYREGAAFALDRTADLIAFGVTRRRLLAGLGPAGLRDVEFFVAEEGNRAVAYVVLTRGPSGLVLEDCGDRDPAGARIGAVLQVLAARQPAGPRMRLRGWLPRALRPPQIRVSQETPAGDIMMVRGFDEASPALHAIGEIVYCNLDVF
jgi:GNAT superfamily N-acetyltransferase